MPIPNVTFTFRDGQLGISPFGNTDSVFAVIGPSSLGQPNTVIPITDPNAITSTIGYGRLAELCGQIFANVSTLIYAIPAIQQPGSVGTIARNRSDAPTLVAASLVGLPGAPVAAQFTNTGSGAFAFDLTSVPLLSNAASPVNAPTEVLIVITTAGAPGTAVASITVGGTTYANKTIPIGPFADPNGTSLVFLGAVPPGGRFEDGDTFTAVSTPNDTYPVQVTIGNITPAGVANYVWSLDGGVTNYPGSVRLGCTQTVTGATQPELTIGGSAPTTDGLVEIKCMTQGTAKGVSAQFGDAAGQMFNAGTGSASAAGLATVSITTPSSGAISVPVKLLVTNAGTVVGGQFTGTGGGATGTWNIDSAGTGTAHGTLTIGANVYTLSTRLPATFIDQPSGLTIAFSTGAGNFVNAEVYQSSGVLINSGSAPTGALVAVGLGSTPASGHTISAVATTAGATGTAIMAVTIDGTLVAARYTVGSASWGDLTGLTLIINGNTALSLTGITTAAGLSALIDAQANVGVTTAIVGTRVQIVSTGALVITGTGTGSTPGLQIATGVLTGIPFVTHVDGLTLDFSTIAGSFSTTLDDFEYRNPTTASTTSSPYATFTITNTRPAGSTTGVTIAGAAGSTLGQPSSSPNVPNATGVTLLFAATNTDLYTYSSTAPSTTTDYRFNVYASYGQSILTTPSAAGVNLREPRDGSYVGLNLQFGFGTYRTGDTYTFAALGPTVAESDALNALTVAETQKGIDYSMVHFTTEPASWDDAGTLCSAVNTSLETYALDPNWRFVRAVVHGPNIPSGTGNGTPAEFVAATNDLALKRVATAFGQCTMVSALSQRRILANNGFPLTAELAFDQVQQDPGQVSNGPVTNVVAESTPLADAMTVNDNRGVVLITRRPLTGFYINKGWTLAAPGSDYSRIPRCRVIDKCAKFGRAALLQYEEITVATVPGLGKIDPTSAQDIETTVANKIQAQTAGEQQGIVVSVDRNADVLATETLPVSIGVRPFAYVDFIPVSIGFLK